MNLKAYMARVHTQSFSDIDVHCMYVHIMYHFSFFKKKKAYSLNNMNVVKTWNRFVHFLIINNNDNSNNNTGIYKAPFPKVTKCLEHDTKQARVQKYIKQA